MIISNKFLILYWS